MSRLALLVLLADASGPSASETPLVAFACVSKPGAEGSARAGVLDARNGRVLWSVPFAGGVNDARVESHGDVLSVVVNSRSEGYSCHVFTRVTGRARFRVDGARCLELPGRRRLLAFPGRERTVAVDPVTGLEAWSAPATRHLALSAAPGRDFLLAEGPRHLSAYALEDGRPAWEREKAGTERLVASAGRLFSLRPGEPRLVEVDPLTGGEKSSTPLPGPLVAIVAQRDFVDLVLEGEALRLRAADLGREWSTPLPASAASGSGDARSIVLNGAGEGERLILLDAPTGRIVADVPAERFFPTDVSFDHPLYLLRTVRGREGKTALHVHDRRDGRIAWKDEVEGVENPGAGETLLLQRNGRLVLADLGARVERWSLAPDGPWKAAARRSGLVLVATSRSISGVHVATGREAWKLPLEPDAAEVRFAR